MSRTSIESSAVPALVPSHEPADLSSYDVPHPRPFVCEITVGSELLSRAIPHVFNIEYVRWLDRAAELHSDSAGYTREAMLNENIMWFVARHEIDYLAEAWLNDRLLIATWVRDFKRVKSWREYVILRPADEAVICRCTTLWVLVDLETRRPKRIPQEMIRAFDPLEVIGGS
jgi:acyl-CoA thioester hydrolase